MEVPQINLNLSSQIIWTEHSFELQHCEYLTFKSFKKKLAADHFSGLENKPNNCDVTIFQQQCRIFFENFLCSFQLECMTSLST